MKTRILSVIIIATFLFLSPKSHGETNGWPSVKVSSLITDKYLGFGTGNLLSEDPAVQTGLLISFKNGLFLDLWSSRSLKGKWDDGNLGNEIDYQVGWSGPIASNLVLLVGLTYFDEPKAFTLGAGDILYPHIFLTKNFKLLSVTAGFENYTTMPDSGFQGGNLLSLGVSKYQLLYKDKIGLRASVTAVYDTGTLGSGEGFILRGSAGADWNLSKRLTFNALGINWYAPLTPKDKRVADAVFYSGFKFKFN